MCNIIQKSTNTMQNILFLFKINKNNKKNNYKDLNFKTIYKIYNN